MQSCISARESGLLSRDAYKRTISTHLLKSFAPAPQLRFNGHPPAPGTLVLPGSDRPSAIDAHRNGVNALALDKFDGRWLLSGGADGSVRIWDLEARFDGGGGPQAPYTYTPTASVPRVAPPTSTTPHVPSPPRGHTHGVTHLAFYPFDADAFLSSSFDHSLLLWSTTRAQPASAFDLGTTVYSHATSAVAPHLLVACATQHAAVRLVDLRSGAAIHALAGGTGPVLATAWSPRAEHVLASGHADGSVRVWDVRRAGAMIGLLDREDSLGVVHRLRHAVAAGASSMPRSRAAARAHADAVNALAWTDDGRYIISGGLDRRIRVWDAATGANTLASFGSVVQNAAVRHQTMIVSPSTLTLGCREILFWPNEREILALDLHEGKVLSRLKTPGIPNLPSVAAAPTSLARRRGPNANLPPSSSSSSSSSSPSKYRIMAIAWRGVGGHGRQSTTRMGGADAVGGIYAAHADGKIRAWMPTIPGPDGDGDGGDVDEGEYGNREAEKRRKRKALNDIFDNLMRTGLTFTDAPVPGA